MHMKDFSSVSTACTFAMNQYRFVFFLACFTLLQSCNPKNTVRVKSDLRYEIYDFSELKKYVRKHWRKDKDKNLYYTKNEHFKNITYSLVHMPNIDTILIGHLLGLPTNRSNYYWSYDVEITDLKVGEKIKGTDFTIRSTRRFFSIGLASNEKKSNGIMISEISTTQN